MNIRLKQLAQRGGMDLDKVQALLDLHDGDEAWVEQLILGADTAQKAAMASGVAYKAVEDDAGGDAYPADLLDALDAAYDALGGDWTPITQALEQLASGAEPIKARVLTDSGPQSAFPTTKAYNPQRDPYAVAVGADQIQMARPAVLKASQRPTMKQLIEASLNNMGDLH